MKDLAGIQRAFQRHIYRPATSMERAVLGAPRASAARRLSVYADAYRARLAEVLESDYPALREHLGGREFAKLAAAYIAAHPSRNANVRWYGGKFAPYLERTPRWRARPRLAELAAFEWALGLAFDAADAPLLDAKTLAQTVAEDWPGMRFKLHPSVHRLELTSNAPELWQSMVGDKRLSIARVRRASSSWLVWRNVHTPYFRVLGADEAWAHAAVRRGRDFAAICNGLCHFVGDADAAQRGAQLLRTWLDEGQLSAAR